MKQLTIFFILIFKVGTSFGQLNFAIKDGINLLSSNPYFIESMLNYEDYSFDNIESKFNIYNKKGSSNLKFSYSFSGDRINVVSWNEELRPNNYNSLVQDVTHLGFVAVGEKISNYTDFNTSFQGFVNESMNCSVSIIENRNKNVITISISRKDNNRPLVIPNSLFSFEGSKTFSDGLKGWNLHVKIKEDQIEIITMPHPENEYWIGKKYTPNIVKGYIKNGIIYSTLNEEGATEIKPSIFKYFKEKMYEANIEGGYNEYRNAEIKKIVINITPPKKNQTEEKQNIEDNKIYNSDVIDVPPAFNGGINKFSELIQNAVQLPDSVLNSQEYGSIVFRIIIENDGTISTVETLRDPFGNIGQLYFDYIQTLKFLPGVQNGRRVRTSLSIPFSFRKPN